MGEIQKIKLSVLQAFLPSANLSIFSDVDEKLLAKAISLLLSHEREEVFCIKQTLMILSLINNLQRYNDNTAQWEIFEGSNFCSFCK